MNVLTKSTSEIRDTLISILSSHFNKSDSEALAEIFLDSELDGVKSHGLARFPRLINETRDGYIQPGKKPSLSKSFAGWETWDGHSGAGPLNALFCTQRAVEVAQQFGIACVGLKNTNHWLRPGHYAKVAALNGCAFIGWSNTMPNMRAHNANKTSLGNSPISIGLPTGDGSDNITFVDLALSQFSYGKMKAYVDSETTLPVDGGYDDQNNPTSDPNIIMKNQSASAIGYWKGSALSIILDMLAVLLSGGSSVFEIGQKPGEQDLSQVFIAIALDKLWDNEEYARRLAELKQQLKMIDSSVHIPSEKRLERRQGYVENGISLPADLWQEILDLNVQ